MEDGIILKGTCIIIPHKKHQVTLQLIHEGHLGLGKCKLRSKDTVYWPGLNDKLEKLILNCELCLKYYHCKCKQKSSTSLGQEIPVDLWSKLAFDIFHFDGSSYLLIVDYTSRFPVLCKLSLMKGEYIANQCNVMYRSAGTLILLELSRGMASHILLKSCLLGALQDTKLIFRFSFLHTLRQY